MVREEVPLTLDLDVEATWYRNADGTTIHRPTCRHAREPWPYAQDWSDDRVKHYADTIFYVTLCRVCW